MAEGETKAWICTACGYIHDGETPPDRCPVCAVPADCFQPRVEVEEDGLVIEDVESDDEG